MRSILFNLGPLPLWSFFLIVTVIFLYIVLASLRESKQSHENPSIIIGLDFIVYLVILFFIYRFRGSLSHSVPIHAYGTMLMLAFLAGIGWCSHSSKGTKLDFNSIIDLFFYIILSSIVFARVLFVLLQWKVYQSDPLEIVKVWDGGLSFHGGLLGGLLVIWIFCYSHKLSFWTLCDFLSPAAALGYGIARIGCFLNGCCYGIPCNLPWAVRFTPGDVPRHPTQIYSSLISFGIFGLLLLWKKKSIHRGHLTLAYFILYSVYRFGIEFLRKGASADPGLWGFTQAQVACLLIIPLCMIAYWYFSKKMPLANA